MKSINYKNILLLLIIVFQFMSCSSEETLVSRSRESFDFDWKFQLGDIENAELETFDDSLWRTLDVPHDWSIEGEYNQNNPAGIAGAFLPTGTGWYRKELTINKLDSNNRYFIEFDGVYMNSDVYVNGQLLGNRPYGYISFSYNLTPHLKEGGNIIAVKVDNSKSPSGRWYTGSGIYRHVWLTHTNGIYAEQWGTKVTTLKINLENQKALVQYESKLINSTLKSEKIKIKSDVLDSNENVISTNEKTYQIEETLVFNQEFELDNVDFWSPENPNMYSLNTKVYIGKQLIDQYTTPFGIRSIELKGSKGFFLNGKPIKFKGLSNHHDAGPVGAAVPDDILYKRLKLLKEMGTNALRTTHNPFSPTFYTMCDTLGIMVMDEAFDGWWKTKAKFDYGIYFKDWWKKDLTDFIKRDQNHPSVVIWSIGNEVHKFTAEEQKVIIDFAKKIDNTRPYTQGSGYSAPHIDIAGFNGHGEYRGSLEKYHKKNPDKAIIGTEITHTLQTRGVYRTKTWYRTKDNPAPWEKPEHFAKMEPRVFKIPDLASEEVFSGITKKYQSSYDNSIVRIGIRDDWNRVEKLDYYLGNFRWTGFDYLGESFGWPARTANFGIIDLAGFPKDHYYLYQSLWSDKPMVHMLPHWTHTGKEGMEIPVVVYTNCDSAELFLNGNSLGDKKMTSERQIVWQVPYKKGELKVVAKNNGSPIIEKTYKSAGEATKINLKTDKSTIQANKTDVVHIEVSVEDSENVILPDANNLIEFEITGPAKLLGVENGDILDLSPHKIKSRKAFKGKCLLLLQSTEDSGTIEIKANSEGLQSATLNISAN